MTPRLSKPKSPIWARPACRKNDGLLIASALALIDDMDSPFRGYVVVSPQPMQRALAEISAP
jgi:hypothetical protein